MHPPAMHPSAPGLLPTPSMAVQIPTAKVSKQNFSVQFQVCWKLWGSPAAQYSKYPRLLLCSSLEHDVTRLSACRCVESLSHSSFCVPQRIQTLTVTFCFLVSVTRPRFRAPPRLLVTASSPTARAARGSTTTGSNSTSQLPCWMTSGCIIRHMNSFSLISCIVSFYVLNLLISDNSFLFFFLQNILY